MFSCSVCNRQYRDIKTLNRHKKSHGAKKYSCNTCLLSFIRHDALLAHKRYVCNAPVERLPCSMCNSVFKRKGDLKVHMRDYHPPPPSAQDEDLVAYVLCEMSN